MFRRFDRALVRPALIVAAVLAYGQPLPIGAQSAPLPPGREVVARHLKAMGGAGAFKAVQSMHAKGTLSMVAQGLAGDIEVFSARPNKQLLRTEIPGLGRIETGYDGKVGWSIDPVTGATLLSGRQLAELMDDAWFDSPLYPAEHVKDVTTVAREQFDNRAAYRVKVTLASGSEQFEFFDVETGLQLGTESRRESQLGVAPITSVVRDYKPFGGLMLPTTLVQKMLGFEHVVTLASYEFNAVPPETFALPPQIKALIKMPAALAR